MRLVCLGLLLSGLGANVADVERALENTLAGHGGSVAEAQRALSATLGWSAVSESGVIVAGDRPVVEDLPAARIHEEAGHPVPVLRYFRVGGRGPRPLEIHVPVPEDVKEAEVFRHAAPQLFLRVEEFTHQRRTVSFKADFPGRFVVRKPDEHSYIDAKSIFPEYPEPSAEPGAKQNWHFSRVEADTVTGPLPVVLVHGASTDRWAEFRHWCANSPEAGAFRREFQIWNFSTNIYGINAPIGFDPECPMFDESIAAYLDRFMRAAMTEGVLNEGVRHYFPDGPFCMVAHSAGGTKVQAFLKNFPEHAARLLAVISLGGTHTGTPGATGEWLRHTVSRLGICTPNWAELAADVLINAGYVSFASQSDLDLGWSNVDAASDEGLPCVSFKSWDRDSGRTRRVLSPRDANRSDARALPEFEDDGTFEPQHPMETYCGGMDLVLPQRRGECCTDRYFLHASYIIRGRGWLGLLFRAGDGIMPWATNLSESIALRFSNLMLGVVKSKNSDWPTGAYRLSDGFVPLQSQLMLDGHERGPIYRVNTFLGWRHPKRPIELDMDRIARHTLVNPDRIRIWPGWSHLETVTGRYNKKDGHSRLFCHVAKDLLSVLGETE